MCETGLDGHVTYSSQARDAGAPSRPVPSSQLREIEAQLRELNELEDEDEFGGFAWDRISVSKDDGELDEPPIKEAVEESLSFDGTLDCEFEGERYDWREQNIITILYGGLYSYLRCSANQLLQIQL